MPELYRVHFAWVWSDMVWKEISKLIWLFWTTSMNSQMLSTVSWSQILKTWSLSPMLTPSQPFRKELSFATEVECYRVARAEPCAIFIGWPIILISKPFNFSKIMKSTEIRLLKNHAKTSGFGISLMVIFNAQECISLETFGFLIICLCERTII